MIIFTIYGGTRYIVKLKRYIGWENEYNELTSSSLYYRKPICLPYKVSLCRKYIFVFLHFVNCPLGFISSASWKRRTRRFFVGKVDTTIFRWKSGHVFEKADTSIFSWKSAQFVPKFKILLFEIKYTGTGKSSGLLCTLFIYFLVSLL